jgi:predicted DCC family thiol-disulfide oxidoreductase YuxK
MLPDENIIIFDGVCNFCSRTVQFVLRNDRRAMFRFAPVQSAVGSALLSKHGLDPTDVETFLLVRGDAAFVRSEAALEIAKGLGLPWSLLAVFRLLPVAWRDAAYDVVARNRYSWFGRRASCYAPAPEERSRFISAGGQFGDVQQDGKSRAHGANANR